MVVAFKARLYGGPDEAMHNAQVPWLKGVFGSEALPLGWLGLA